MTVAVARASRAGTASPLAKAACSLKNRVWEKRADAGLRQGFSERKCHVASGDAVYNLRVAEYHTYFVGCDEWGFSVWAHNADCGWATVQKYLQGEVKTVRLQGIGPGRPGKIKLSEAVVNDLKGLSADTEIVYIVKDKATGEVLTVGKTSIGENAVNVKTRVQKYVRQEEFLNSHADASVPRVQLEMEYVTIKPEAIKQFQAAGIEVEKGVEAPLRAELAKKWQLSWDNSGGRLGVDGPKWVSENPELLKKWIEYRKTLPPQAPPP